MQESSMYCEMQNASSIMQRSEVALTVCRHFNKQVDVYDPDFQLYFPKPGHLKLGELMF